MSIDDQKERITKHQRYYRKNRERRKREALEWQYKNPIRSYIQKRKWELNRRRKKIIKQLEELQNV
jgi:hypothetical protein